MCPRRYTFLKAAIGSNNLSYTDMEYKLNLGVYLAFEASFFEDFAFEDLAFEDFAFEDFAFEAFDTFSAFPFPAKLIG